MKDTFGQWLKRKRKEKGFTQSELAKQVGVSLPYISKLERDQPHSETNARPQPKVAVVDRLAKALGASAQEARDLAFGGSVTVLANALAEDELLIIDCYRALPAERRADVRACIELFFERYGAS